MSYKQVENVLDRNKLTIGVVLFDGFETLDVFGPVQMLGRLPKHKLAAISQTGDPVISSQGLATIVHHDFADVPPLHILLVPGGMGTRSEIANSVMLDFLQRKASEAAWVASVCTGAALLAAAGMLNGRRATTNKTAFDWVSGQSSEVKWQPRARWVIDGNILTSSGVSAGTDMALALVEQLYGRERAETAARAAEYVWNDDPNDDPFARHLSPV